MQNKSGKSLALAAAFAGLLGGTTARLNAELLPHGGSTASSVRPRAGARHRAAQADIDRESDRGRGKSDSVSIVAPAATIARRASCRPLLLAVRRISTSATRQNIAPPSMFGPTYAFHPVHGPSPRLSLGHAGKHTVPHVGCGQLAILRPGDGLQVGRQPFFQPMVFVRKRGDREVEEFVGHGPIGFKISSRDVSPMRVL
jgi:hypothetical protein